MSNNIIDSIRLSGTTYQIQGEITVDAALDSGSTNPVENKAIYSKFDEVEQVTAAALNVINGKLDDKVNVVDNEVPDYNVTSEITYQGGYPSQTETASTWADASMFTLRYNFFSTSDTNYTVNAAVIDPSGNITTGSATVEESVANPLPDYIDMVKEVEIFVGAKYYFTAKEGYRIAHLDVLSQSTWGSGYGNIIEERVDTVFEGGQSADVIKDVIEPTLISKQDQLVSGTNIKTINNQSLLGSGNIDIQGGGKAIEAGRGISITTGETADTVSFNLPISAGTGTNSIAEGNRTTANGSYSHAEGYYTTTYGSSSHAEGTSTTAGGGASHAEGSYTAAYGDCSHTEGWSTIANNQSEHASGQYNNSVSASTTFGDSGNTLFSVGNGTPESARHNAFEIRQNGDIYISSGNTDIKLQDHLGGGSVTVDTELDSGSTNPVQNKVIYAKIDEVEEVTAAGLNSLNNKITPTVELTQAQYDALTVKDPNTYYIITDAQAGDLTNYYTKSETNTLLGGKADTATTYTKTETDNAITAATSTKQDTLVSGTNIKTINNTSILGSGNIDIQGGGKAVSGGTNISITTGETADTINCTLNISNGTGGLSIKSLGATSASANHSAAFGQNTKATNTFAFAEGWGTTASGSRSHSEGDQTVARGGQSHAEGTLTKAIADHSHSEGYASSATSRVTTMVGITTPYGWNTRHSEGYATIADNGCTHTEGLSTKALNVAEHSSGAYNVSYTASTTWGDSGNTLFSVGNGTADNARHNAFEIRQNGDIYLSLNGQDVKLQDQLGGSSITVDTALSPTSENPVQNKVIYNKINEVEQVTAAGLNAVNDKFDGLRFKKLTQTEYNNLQTKDPSTLYVIVD